MIGKDEAAPMLRGVWRKVRRFSASLAGSGFTFLGLTVAALGFIAKEPSRWGLVVVPVVAVVGLFFWLLQAWFEYRRKTNDPTWALKYQEMWDKAKSLERPLAAKALLQYKDRLAEIDACKELDDIDDALDILEDIGFYMEGDHISPEVACHHFHHWIRGYWCASHVYVEAWRKREPARWRHIEPLFRATSEVNRGRGNPLPSSSDVERFLEQEAAGVAVIKPA